ncbi:MAG: chorismate mutase [Rhodospirillaceae bacterium]|nr:chorismate mutase [Rhodospirillaceae bacterium]
MINEKSLSDLRLEIDRIDDAMHDLLMQRSKIVEQVNVIKGCDNAFTLYPGRETKILRRLVTRHKGKFSKIAIVRIWREIISGMIELQRNMSIAVFMPNPDFDYLELIRNHYGVIAPINILSSANQVIHYIIEKTATIGIMPMPDCQDQDNEPWWFNLMENNSNLPRIVARLPICDSNNNRSLNVMAIGYLFSEPTGYDRSWFAVETTPDISQMMLCSFLLDEGIETTSPIITHRTEKSWKHLIEVVGYVDSKDHRIINLIEHKQSILCIVILGSYSIPFCYKDLNN